MRRISIVVSELTKFATKNADGPFVNHLWVIKSMFESVSDELDGATDEKLSVWMEQFGRLMLWCASGDAAHLPPEVVDFIQKEHADVMQIEAAPVSD